MKVKRVQNILILGGTSKAAELAAKLVQQPDTRVISSLAGRTRNPATLPGETRIGGFGGVEGLAAYIADENIHLVIDATHPFATQISANAIEATAIAGVKLEQDQRLPWQKQDGDIWHSVVSGEEAAALIPAGARVFLALGSQHLSPFYCRKDVYFLVRMVDAPGDILQFENHDLMAAKPGVTVAAELQTIKAHRISHLVCRNSGGKHGYTKIAAARQLGVPIFMIERPDPVC